MKVDEAKIHFRAGAARLAKSEKLPLDSAAARTGSPLQAMDDRDDAPHQKTIGELKRPPDFGVLQPLNRARPTYDLVAYLAHRCADCYPPDDGLQSKIECDEGGSDFRRFARGTDSAFGYRRGKTLVIAFRGTRLLSLQQWSLTNLRAFPARKPTRHLGFQLAWERLARDILEWIEATRPSDGELMLTGHSLGGAIAIIAAFELAERYPIRAVVTIGAPRVGFNAFRDAYVNRPTRPPRFGKSEWKLGAITRRITHADDFVSRVPPEFIFRHVGDESRLDASGYLGPGNSRQVLPRLYAALDRAIGACYEGLDRALTPSSASISMARALEQPEQECKVTYISRDIMRILHPDPPARPTAVGRAVGDAVSFNAKYPVISLITLPVAQWILIGVGSVIALAMTLLVLLDFGAHRSSLYVDAFGKRYPKISPDLKLSPEVLRGLAQSSELARIYHAPTARRAVQSDEPGAVLRASVEAMRKAAAERDGGSTGKSQPDS